MTAVSKTSMAKRREEAAAALRDAASKMSMDKRQVAAALWCTPRHINRLVASGRLPAGRLWGKRRVWARQVIERLLVGGDGPTEK